MKAKDEKDLSKAELGKVYHKFFEMISASPSYDSDGDIQFISPSGSGLTLVAVIDEGHKEFIRVCIPSIYEVKPGERSKILEACNAANLKAKVGKIYIGSDQKSVWVAYEGLVKDFDGDSLMFSIAAAVPILETASLRFMEILKGAS